MTEADEGGGSTEGEGVGVKPGIYPGEGLSAVAKYEGRLRNAGE